MDQSSDLVLTTSNTEWLIVTEGLLPSLNANPSSVVARIHSSIDNTQYTHPITQ